MTKARDLGDFISDGTIAETVTADGLNLGDNEKIQLGASQDLQIYHTGSTSYIFEQGTGDLRIRGNQVRIEDGDGSTIALFQNDSGAQLRYDGTIALETTATGATVTGTVAVSGSFNATSGTFTVQDNGTDILNVTSTLMSPQTDGAISLGSSSNGFNELYLDGNANVGGNVIINSTANTPVLRFDESGAAKFFIGESSAVGGGAGYDLYAGAGDGISLFTNAAERMTIDTSGNVGIGTNSPNNYSANHKSITLNAPTTPIIDLEVNGTRTGSIVAESTKFDFNAVTSVPVRFLTADTERFRIGTSGELGIGGATYGTAGQVLTSGGSGAAPTWADAAGGGTAEFTTSANVTAGDPVILNSNGTVGPVTVTASFPAAITYQINTYSVGTDSQDVFYDPDFGITVIFNKNNGNGNYVFTLYKDGESTFLQNNATIASWNFGIDVKGAAYDPVEKTYVNIYGKSGTWYYRTAQMNSTGTGLSYQAETSLPFNPGYSGYFFSTYDPDSGKIIFVFRDTNNSDYIYYVVGTCSGNSVSFGSKALVYSGVIHSGSYSDPAAITYDETANRVLFCWRDDFTAEATRAIAGSVSGTTVTWGTSVQVDGTANYALALVYDPISGKNLLTYGDGTNTNSRVLTLSGSTISAGAETTIVSAFDQRSSSIYYNEATQEINVVTSNDNNSARIYSGTISGTTWSGSSSTSFYGGRAQQLDSVYNPNFARGMIFYKNATNSDRPTLVIQDTATSDSDEFLGLAAETISSGSTGKVTLLGGVNENQTGLTTNDRLYLNVAGDLTSANTGTSVGRAISSTKVLVTGGQ